MLSPNLIRDRYLCSSFASKFLFISKTRQTQRACTQISDFLYSVARRPFRCTIFTMFIHSQSSRSFSDLSQLPSECLSSCVELCSSSASPVAHLLHSIILNPSNTTQLVRIAPQSSRTQACPSTPETLLPTPTQRPLYSASSLATSAAPIRSVL